MHAYRGGGGGAGVTLHPSYFFLSFALITPAAHTQRSARVCANAPLDSHAALHAPPSINRQNAFASSSHLAPHLQPRSSLSLCLLPAPKHSGDHGDLPLRFPFDTE